MQPPVVNMAMDGNLVGDAQRRLQHQLDESFLVGQMAFLLRIEKRTSTFFEQSLLRPEVAFRVFGELVQDEVQVARLGVLQTCLRTIADFHQLLVLGIELCVADAVFVFPD